MEEMTVSDVELKTDYGRIAIAGLPNHSENCARIFEALARDGVVVSAIILNRTARGTAELTFSVPRADLSRAAEISRQITAKIHPNITTVADDDAAILLLWGVGMRSHAGVARTVFGTLAEQGINVRTSNTSEVCITVVVERRNGESALKALRTVFPAT
jgi:aspartate kinase